MNGLGVQAAMVLGKCNSSSQPGVGVEREAKGEEALWSSGRKCGIGGSHREDPGVRVSEASSAHRGPGEGEGGGSPVWSPGRHPPARSRFPPKPPKSQCTPRVATLFGER